MGPGNCQCHLSLEGPEEPSVDSRRHSALVNILAQFCLGNWLWTVGDGPTSVSTVSGGAQFNDVGGC